MRLSDVRLGQIVYLRKNIGKGNPDIPRMVEHIEVRKNKHNRIHISGMKLNPGELTDIPCNLMTCERCKYHE